MINFRNILSPIVEIMGRKTNPAGFNSLQNPTGFAPQPTVSAVGHSTENHHSSKNPAGFAPQPTVSTVGHSTVGLSTVGLTALLLLATACGKKDTPSAAAVQVADESIPVKTLAIQQKSINLPIHTSGILTSSAEQRLSFKIGGIIRNIYVEEGSMVRAGQLLAVLDKTEIDAQVVQAQQGLAKSERDLARVEGLYKDSSATLELLQNATTGRDIAKETARIATFNQQYAEIRATKSGKIIKKLMNEGEITGPGTPVFVLFETGANDWIIKTNVSDRDWAQISKGMAARVTMDAYPGTIFSCKVTDLAPAADPQSGLYPIEIGIAPQGRRFAPGLFAQVDITPAQTRPYTLIPIESIVEGDGKSAFVYALQPDGTSVRKMPVQIAFMEGNMAVISNGLDGVSEVITSGAPYLTEKKKVKKTN
jgi:RND family efflux transporter MFP subunit